MVRPVKKFLSWGLGGISLLSALVLWVSVPALSMPGRSFRGSLPDLLPEELALSRQLKDHVETLSMSIGERHLYKPEKLRQTVDYLKSWLNKDYSAVESQSFTFNNQEFENIIVERPGRSRKDEIIVVGAHYDSVFDCPGANDNGTGVAAGLALAAVFARENPERTVRFVFFPNEEQYFNSKGMGSYHYAKACKERSEKIVSMISLETIGFYSDVKGSQKYPPGLKFFYPRQGNFIGFIGPLGSRKAIKPLLKAFRKTTDFPSEGLCAPSIVPGVDWSDHQWFNRFGYPAFMVTDTAPYRYPYYHTAEDTAEKIDYKKMARVVAGLKKALLLVAS